MDGGANSSIFGFNTSRKHIGIGIFKLPKDKKWRSEVPSIILKDRVIDESFRRQIDDNTLHICELHFKVDDLYYCKHIY